MAFVLLRIDFENAKYLSAQQDHETMLTWTLFLSSLPFSSLILLLMSVEVHIFRLRTEWKLVPVNRCGGRNRALKKLVMLYNISDVGLEPLAYRAGAPSPSGSIVGKGTPGTKVRYPNC